MIGSCGGSGARELLAMYDAAAEVIECAAALADRGKNPVTEVLAGADPVEEWAHFPPGDVIDPERTANIIIMPTRPRSAPPASTAISTLSCGRRILFPDLAPAAVADNADVDRAIVVGRASRRHFDRRFGQR